MKAILVIDMPKSCVECPCFERHEKDEWWCDAYGNYIGDEKPEWCPLKPMPTEISPIQVLREQIRVLGDSRLAKEVSQEWCDGWNECLREILDDSH